MDTDIFWSNVLKLKDKEDSLFMFLKNSPLFENFSKKDLKNMEKIVHLRKFKKNEIIFKEHEPGTGMYIIKSGRVRITKEKINVEDGTPEEDNIVVLKKNDFFGELNLVEKTRFPRTASASAEDECELVGLFKPDLLEIIERNPKLGIKLVMKISEIIGVRLRITTTSLTEKKEEIKRLKALIPQKEKKISPL